MKETGVALIIDSDDFVRRGLSFLFQDCGFSTFESGTYAHPATNGVAEYSTVLCEIELANAVGVEVFIRQVQEHSKGSKVVLTSSNPNASQALQALAAGAHDFLVTPAEREEVESLCSELTEATTRPCAFNKRAKAEPEAALPLVGRSKTFIDMVKSVSRVAPTNLPVFLVGESGTGKEVAASVLHQRSNRPGPFVPVNCAALPAELIESELFGHVKGSFTGADRDRPGLWEQADGGTIFLDEITETSTAFQVKLLRTLQDGEVRRVGSNTSSRVDVRVIAASNRDVESEVNARRFRQDLFYRLNAISVRLPPLRERTEDIPLLVESFIKRYSGKQRPRVSTEALELLIRYSWPGNIRELENVVLGSVAMCQGVVTVKHLPERIRTFVEESTGSTSEQSASELTEPKRWQTLAALQRDYVTRVLSYTRGNKQAAARLLAVDRKTLDRMIKRHAVVAKISDLQTKAA